MRVIGTEGICSIEKPTMLCEGLIPSTGIMLVAGAPGVSKTWYGLECGLALTAQVKAFGRFSAPSSKVLYIGEDSPGWDVGAMVRKLLRGHGLTPSDPESLMFCVHQGANLNEIGGMLELIGIRDDYMSDHYQDDDSELIETPPRGLIIIDNLRKLHAKRESNSDDMVLVMDRLRELAKGVCVMVLHHPSKPAEFERENWAEIRGSGEIVGGSDAVVFLKRKRNRVSARVIRARAAMPMDFDYEIEDEGDEVRLVAVNEEDESTALLKELCGKNATLDRQIIYQLLDDRGFKGSPEAKRKKVTRMLQVAVAEGFMKKWRHNAYKSLIFQEIAK